MLDLHGHTARGPMYGHRLDTSPSAHLWILRQLRAQAQGVAPVAQRPAVFRALLDHRKKFLPRSNQRSLRFICSRGAGFGICCRSIHV